MTIWNENIDDMYDWDFVIFEFKEGGVACGVPYKKYKKLIKRWAKLDDLLNQQAEINRLREALDRILNYNSVKEQTDKYFYIVMDVRKIARKALNSESEEK